MVEPAPALRYRGVSDGAREAWGGPTGTDVGHSRTSYWASRPRSDASGRNALRLTAGHEQGPRVR